MMLSDLTGGCWFLMILLHHSLSSVSEHQASDWLLLRGQTGVLGRFNQTGQKCNRRRVRAADECRSVSNGFMGGHSWEWKPRRHRRFQTCVWVSCRVRTRSWGLRTQRDQLLQWFWLKVLIGTLWLHAADWPVIGWRAADRRSEESDGGLINAVRPAADSKHSCRSQTLDQDWTTRKQNNSCIIMTSPPHFLSGCRTFNWSRSEGEVPRPLICSHELNQLTTGWTLTSC